uniref:E3 ubiquitin-protein ligase n=1 Tax=Clandestinovirus TaxID=2831644 RepID=A0A8F8KT78_9VIRU|nr:E3 ubiquitin-protein ligase [Clandestinovirus]
MGSYQDLPTIDSSTEDVEVEEIVEESSRESDDDGSETDDILKRARKDLSLADFSVVTRLADIGYYFYCLDEADRDMQSRTPLTMHINTLAKFTEPKKMTTAIKIGKSRIKKTTEQLKTIKQFWETLLVNYMKETHQPTDLSEVFKCGFVDEELAPIKLLDDHIDSDSQTKTLVILDSFLIPQIVIQLFDGMSEPEDGEVRLVSLSEIEEEIERLESTKSNVSVFTSKWESAKMSVLHGARTGVPNSTKAAILEQLHQGFLAGSAHITTLSSNLEDRVKISQVAMTNWKKLRSSIKPELRKMGYVKLLSDVAEYGREFWSAWSYALRKINNGNPMEATPTYTGLADGILQQTLERLCFPGIEVHTSEPSRWSLDKTSNMGWIDHWSYIMRARQSFVIKEASHIKIMATLMPDDSLYALTSDPVAGERWMSNYSMLMARESSEYEARHFTIPKVKKWVQVGPSTNESCLLPFSLEPMRLVNENEWAEGSCRYGFEVYSSRYWVPLSWLVTPGKPGIDDYPFTKALSYCAINGSFGHNLCTLFSHIRDAGLQFDHVSSAMNAIEVSPNGKLRLMHLNFLYPANDDGKELAQTLSVILASCHMVVKYNERTGIISWDAIKEHSLTNSFLFLLMQPKINTHWKFDTWIKMTSMMILSSDGLQKSLGLSDAPKLTGANSQINTLGPQLMRIYDILEERRQNNERTLRFHRNDGIVVNILRYYIYAEDSDEFDDKSALLKRLRSMEVRRTQTEVTGNTGRRIVVSAATRRTTRNSSSATSMNTTDTLPSSSGITIDLNPTEVYVPSRRDRMEIDSEEDDDGLDYRDCLINIVPSFGFEGESGSGIGVTSEVLAFFWETILTKHKFFARSISPDSEPYYYIKDCQDVNGDDIECPGCGDGKRCIMYDLSKSVARIWAHTFLTLQEDYNRLLPFSLATLVLKILLLPSCILALDLGSEQESRVLSLLLNEDDLREVDPSFWNRLRYMNNMSHSELKTYMEEEDSDVIYGKCSQLLTTLPLVGTPKLRPEDLEEYRYATIEQRFFSGPRAKYYFDLARHWQLLMRDFVDVNALHTDSLRYYLSSKPTIDISQLNNRITFVVEEGVNMTKAVMEEYAQQFRNWVKKLDQVQVCALLKYWTGQSLIPQHSTLLVEFVKSQAEIQAATCYASLRVSANRFSKPEEFGEWLKDELEKGITKDSSYLKYNTL